MLADRSAVLAQLATTSRLTDVASEHLHKLTADRWDCEESWTTISSTSELLEDLRVRVEGEYPGASGSNAINHPLVAKCLSQFKQDVEAFLVDTQRPDDGRAGRHGRAVGPDDLNELADSAEWLKERLSPIIAGGTIAPSPSSKSDTTQLLQQSHIPLKILILLVAAAAVLFMLRSAVAGF
ncbi:hypothetical protein K490DRAFT_66673 [Saccharata proteae CBS 121410]|uniref:Uncharacterized protein n=1 Tax=Saccharata proteae CBS 121410 TaxID=1314787 RepID=A0A9P4HVN3_9PEZI|nr:hypothetical protein K490DRAFT_66673 [Saccharata proteae CBS 121410]